MKIEIYTIQPSNDKEKNLENQILRGAFSLRYEVYCEEMGIAPPDEESKKNEMLCDNFDSTPNSYIFVATANDSDDSNRAIGTVRLTKYSEKGIPLFSSNKSSNKKSVEEIIKKINFYEKINDGRIFSEASRFVIDKNYRRKATKGKSLVSAFLINEVYQKSKEDGITDMLIVINPKLENMYKEIGFKIIGKKIDELTNIESPIMYAERKDVEKFFRKLEKFLYLKQLWYGMGRIPKYHICL